MLSLIGLLIILILVGYIIKVASGFLNIPNPVVQLLLLLLGLVFVIYVLSFLGMLPEGILLR